MAPTFSRRAALAALPLVGSPGHAPSRADAASTAATVRVDVGDPRALPFDRRGAGIVGVYDIDWLLTPGFGRLLDNLAASPGAFSGVRVFGALTAGKPELFKPEGGGSVWSSPDAPIDLSRPLDDLAALTSRGLTPIVVLGFFPPAVSPSPIQPPADWDSWRTLVRTFLETLATDPRFGPDAIATWLFKVWNEPNEGRFWSGAQDDYLALHRATSEAIATTGLTVRLGGPAIAYKPQASPADGLPWVDRFLRHVAADQSFRLDVLSIHRKGTVGDDPPNPRRLHDAADEVAARALAIDPVRFAGLTILNDEADEKVGFEVPYAPRMDAANAAWLGAANCIAATLTDRHRDAALRFLMAADNANLQLVQSPFDGRRSIMTLASSTSGTDLLKLPAYAFYEMLRLLGDRQLPIAAGVEHLFPATDLYHLATAADTHVGILLAHYPDPDRPHPIPRIIDYVVLNLPWPKVNVAIFRIDARTSNAHTAAGGSPANPYPVPDPTDLPAIRRAQGLALARPITRGVAAPDGIYREIIELEPYATVCLWITPASDAVPTAPAWIEVVDEPAGDLVRWEPTTDPAFLTYELYSSMEDGDDATIPEPTNRLTPNTLRAALWVDPAAPAGRRYAVRTVSASGIASPLAVAGAVAGPPTRRRT